MERRVNRKWVGLLVSLLLILTSWVMLCRAVLAANPNVETGMVGSFEMLG